MNENIDLTKILKGCPVGTEFYHTVYGRVYFSCIKTNLICPIRFTFTAFNKSRECGVTYKGLHSIYNGECILFPSKEQRDWSKFRRFWDEPKVEKFDVNTLQPFDKILVRSSDIENWTIDFYSYWRITSFQNEDKYIQALVYSWKHVIPYNEETKHLVGTSDDCPDYYKWWEKEQ